MTDTTIVTKDGNVSLTAGIDPCESFQQLNALLEKKRRLVQRIEELPSQIVQAHESAAAFHQEAISAEMAVIGAHESLSATAQKEHDEALAVLQQREVESELTERRLRATLAALEQAVGKLDDDIETEAGVVRADASSIASTVLAMLAQEVETAVVPLQAVYSKVAALMQTIGLPNGNDFLQSAFVPSPELSFRHHMPGGGTYDVAPNLLLAHTTATDSARAEIRTAMKPVCDALRAAASHVRHVPLEKRPKPYVIKGTTVIESGPRSRFGNETVIR